MSKGRWQRMCACVIAQLFTCPTAASEASRDPIPDSSLPSLVPASSSCPSFLWTSSSFLHADAASSATQHQ